MSWKNLWAKLTQDSTLCPVGIIFVFEGIITLLKIIYDRVKHALFQLHPKKPGRRHYYVKFVFVSLYWFEIQKIPKLLLIVNFLRNIFYTSLGLPLVSVVTMVL